LRYSLKIGDDLPHYPIDHSAMPQVRTRLKLAKKIDDISRSERKQKAKSDWMHRNAEAAGIILDEDEGVYVIINRYVIQRPNDEYPHSEARSFSRMFSGMKELIGKDNLPESIVGFTKAASKKVVKNDNWIELHDWVAEQVLKLAKKNDIANKAQRVKRTEDVAQSWFVNQKEMKVITKILGQDHPYVEVQDRFYKLGDDKSEVNTYVSMARDWGFKLPKGKLSKGKVDLKALAKQVEEDYPLVKFVQTDTWYDKQSAGLKALCENMIKLDECK
jgi:hypothetical protein